MTENPMELIRSRLSQEELLAQLAEESMELGHAALKLRRAYDGTNPTPVSAADAYDSVLEEIADVSVVLEALGYNGPMPLFEIQKKVNEKLERWVERLEKKEDACVQPVSGP